MATFHEHEAVEYGIEAAIVIQRFRGLIQYHQANGSNVTDGRTWIHNSVRSLTKLFPWWSAKQIRRIMAGLTDGDDPILLAFKRDQARRDQTIWYAFHDESMVEFPKWANPPVAQTGNSTPIESKPLESKTKNGAGGATIVDVAVAEGTKAVRKELSDLCWDAMLSQYEKEDLNSGREGKAINQKGGLIDKALARPKPVEFMRALWVTFYRLRQEDEWWGKQPLLASTLNSGGLFARVVDRARVETEAQTDDDETSALASAVMSAGRRR